MAGEFDVWALLGLLIGFGLFTGLMIGYLWFDLKNRYWLLKKVFKKNYGLFWDVQAGRNVKLYRIDFNEEMPEVDGKKRALPPERVGTWGGTPLAFGDSSQAVANPLQVSDVLDSGWFAILIEKQMERVEAEERAKKKNLAFYLQIGTLLGLGVIAILIIIQIGEVQKVAPTIVSYINQTKAIPVV